MEEVHFKFDGSAKIPFQVRLDIGDKYLFRPINSNDGFLYDLAPQATQNILNQKGFQKGKLIFEDLEQINLSEYAPPILSKQISDEIKKTVYMKKEPFELKLNQKYQLLNYSQIFLSILIHENERLIELEDMITDLELKVEEAQTKTKHIIIVIINANNVQENINSDNQFYDQCFGKIVKTNDHIKNHLILNKYQDSFCLMQFIYGGLAKYFKPQYLYIQETKFQLKSNIFKQNLDLYGIVCPQKQYKQKINNDEPLLLNYLQQLQFYTNIQNKFNSYNYDALNCFQNYELLESHLIKHLKSLQEDLLDPNMHHVNQLLCKQLNYDQMYVIQVGELEYNSFYELTNFQVINLQQEVNFMMNEFSSMCPSSIKQSIMKIILLIDYVSLSSYLYIIIALPYYFMLDITKNQEFQIFIPIIPPFILILIILATLIMVIIFKIDEYYVTDKDKPVSIYVKKVKFDKYIKQEEQSYHYLIDINLSQRTETLPESKLIQYQDMIINLHNIDELVGNEKIHKIKTKPKYLFNYIKFLQQWNILFQFYNIFYLILSAYLIYAYIDKGGEHQLISFQILIFTAFGLFIFLILLFKKNNLFINTKNLFQNFIQINIIYDFSFNYTKSACLERNYYKLKQFQQRIVANFIIIFLYIMIDYGQGFNGRILCAITGYYVVRKSCQIILLLINIQKNDTRKQLIKNVQNVATQQEIEKRLIEDQSQIVDFFNIIINQTQFINKSIIMQRQTFQNMQPIQQNQKKVDSSQNQVSDKKEEVQKSHFYLSTNAGNQFSNPNQIRLLRDQK